MSIYENKTDIFILRTCEVCQIWHMQIGSPESPQLLAEPRIAAAYGRGFRPKSGFFILMICRQMEDNSLELNATSGIRRGSTRQGAEKSLQLRESNEIDEPSGRIFRSGDGISSGG